MKTRVRIGSQVENFVGALAPEPRRMVRRALKGLAEHKGDTRQLEGKLAGLWRLRVGRIRVIYEIKAARGERVFFCFYANYRPVIYLILEQLLASGLVEEIKN
jgi:mRNA-degrading endonuclease RelE of RelBE toxin-antitoxin system